MIDVLIRWENRAFKVSEICCRCSYKASKDSGEAGNQVEYLSDFRLLGKIICIYEFFLKADLGSRKVEFRVPRCMMECRRFGALSSKKIE
jgi:hypothetical protein